MQQAIPWEKIKALETEISQLKSAGKKHLGKKEKKTAGKKKDSLWGLLKGITFTEKEIDEAQKAIFDFKEIK